MEDAASLGSQFRLVLADLPYHAWQQATGSGMAEYGFGFTTVVRGESKRSERVLDEGFAPTKALHAFRLTPERFRLKQQEQATAQPPRILRSFCPGFAVLRRVVRFWHR